MGYHLSTIAYNLKARSGEFPLRASSIKFRRKGLLTLCRCVLIESNQGEHFAGFFAGFGVHEEVLQEDLWSGGVRGAVLVVEVFFDVVLFADCFERLGDLDCLAVCAGDTVGLWGGCHYDELEVSCVLWFSFKFECELGRSEGYDGFGRSFNALECRRVGEGFATAEDDPVVQT